jgi:hypothetical protein
MTLKYRFLLIALGLLIFVVISPVLILFARGYKINFENWEIVKTGSLVVKSEPGRADIYLNDVKQDNDAPATLRFLLPQDYNVRVSKDGYQSWTKRLSVRQEVVTWANLNREFITLFLSEPRLENTQSVQAAALGPEKNRLVFVNDDRISFYKHDDGDMEDIQQNSNWINVKDSFQDLSPANLYYILAAGRSLPLNSEQLLNLKKIQADDNRTILLTGTNLMVLNREGQPALTVPNVIDFALEDNSLWIIETSSLRRVDLNNGSSDLIRTGLPLTDNTSLLRADGRVFLIIGTTLHVVSEELDRIADGITHAYWDNESKQLVYGNEHEIFIYEPASARSDLLLRSASVITNPTLNHETGYVFFSNEGKVKAIELDGRDHRNIYNIADSGSGFMVSKDGKKLFVYDTAGIKTYQIR